MSVSPLHNPYIVGGWVSDNAFYGRIALRYNLLHDPNRQLWVVGTRRVGKTSLLRQLILDAGEAFVPLYWDMQACETADDLDEELYYALEEQSARLQELGVDIAGLRGSDFRQILFTVARAAESRHRDVLLLIDEPEALLDIGRQQDVILRRLRSVFQRHENLRVILSSTKAFARMNEITRHWETSTFLQDFAPRNLAGLDPVEAEALVRQVQGPQRVEADPQTLETILYHTGRHPYLLQWLCRRLYQEDGRLRRPGEDDLRPDGNLNSLFEVSYKHLSEIERRILHHLASAGSEDEAGLAQALNMERADLRLYLYALDRLGYTREVDGRILPGNSFLASWLRTNQASLPITGAEIADGWVAEVAVHGQQQERLYWQQQLQTYRTNLARLEMQAANYGMSPPLNLLNEIDFHRQKIQELERRLDSLAAYTESVRKRSSSRPEPMSF